MSNVIVFNPSDTFQLTFDWNAELVSGVTLVSAVHTVPSPLTKTSEGTNISTAQTQVKFNGGAHGSTYQVQGAATLSNGEVLTRTVAVRAMNS